MEVYFGDNMFQTSHDVSLCDEFRLMKWFSQSPPPRQGKGKMNTYWLIGHKNYSVQNDSLVCHWNPSKARKKKMAAGSEVSVSNVSSAGSGGPPVK